MIYISISKPNKKSNVLSFLPRVCQYKLRTLKKFAFSETNLLLGITYSKFSNKQKIHANFSADFFFHV